MACTTCNCNCNKARPGQLISTTTYPVLTSFTVFPNTFIQFQGAINNINPNQISNTFNSPNNFNFQNGNNLPCSSCQRNPALNSNAFSAYNNNFAGPITSLITPDTILLSPNYFYCISYSFSAVSLPNRNITVTPYINDGCSTYSAFPCDPNGIDNRIFQSSTQGVFNVDATNPTTVRFLYTGSLNSFNLTGNVTINAYTRILHNDNSGNNTRC